MQKYTYYGHELSYFSKKLDAALTFYNAPFDRVDATIAGDLEPARQRAGTHRIPVLETPEGWALWDTTPIMFLLDGRFPKRRMFQSGKTGLLIHVIENFLDEWLGRTMVHYRWNYEECALIAAAKLALGHAENAIGIAKWGSKACRATGVADETQQKLAEAEYQRIIGAVDAQLLETRFLMGDAPCAVDATILGGLRAHTLHDPVPRQMVEQYPRVVNWAAKAENGWDGEGDIKTFNNPTGFAMAMLAEMRGAFLLFAVANRNALVANNKAFLANIYGEEVSFLTRPYPEEACQMVVQHCQRENAAPYIAALGLSALYPV